MKLIRDRYDEIIEPERLTSTKDPTQQRQLLIDKIQEELAELEQSDYKDPSEYADVLEVLISLAEINDVSRHEIAAFRLNKLCDKGGFKKFLILK